MVSKKNKDRGQDTVDGRPISDFASKFRGSDPKRTTTLTTTLAEHIFEAQLLTQFKLAANTVERALHEFDTTYRWGTAAWANDEEPGRYTDAAGARGDGSLRSLWCLWIDDFLAQIDAKAGVWRTNAQDNMETRFKNSPVLLIKVKAFIANEFSGANGLLTTAKMKIPTQTGSSTNSKYGGWGGNSYAAPVRGVVQKGLP